MFLARPGPIDLPHPRAPFLYRTLRPSGPDFLSTKFWLSPPILLLAGTISARRALRNRRENMYISHYHLGDGFGFGLPKFGFRLLTRTGRYDN